MKVQAGSRQAERLNSLPYPLSAKTRQNGLKDSARTEEKTDGFTDLLFISKKAEEDSDIDSVQNADVGEDIAAEEAETSAGAYKTDSGQESEGAGGFKISCSVPDDTTGQLAAMLARAETQMDVQQVASKALRALNALKMSAVFAEGDDAKKAAQRIRRMEKLINRISRKKQQLNKEEILERKRRSAEKRKEAQQEEKLRRELDTRRTKRRRDERNYANREIAQDNKEASQEMYANMAGAASASPVSESDLLAAADLAGGALDLSMAESVGFDVTV